MCFKRTKKNLDEVYSRLVGIENDLWIKKKRIEWLENKLNIKCYHDELDFIEETNQITCKKCGRVWDRHNCLSD